MYNNAIRLRRYNNVLQKKTRQLNSKFNPQIKDKNHDY